VIRSRSLLTAVLGAAGMLGPLSTGAAGDTAQQTPASPAVLGELRSILVPLAGENGDANPTRMRMVETTTAAAMKVLFPGAHSNTPSIPVYLLAAHGHFVQRDALAPPHARAQTGSTLYILLTQPGEGVNVWGIIRRNPDLRKLGTVQALDVQPPPASTPPVNAPVLTQLQAILVARARASGDPTPTLMQAVATNSFAASSYLASGWATDQPAVPVYALCAKGRFGSATVSVPPRVHATGPVPTTLCLIVMAQGLGVTTVSLGSHYPDLRKLGPVEDLAPAPAA
jgi:hypothetical protein